MEVEGWARTEEERPSGQGNGCSVWWQAPEAAPFQKDDCSHSGSQPAASARTVGRGREIAGNLAPSQQSRLAVFSCFVTDQ
jgi:hypothetical protein